METNVKFETIRIPAAIDEPVSGIVATPEWWPSGQRIGLVIAHDLAGGMEEPMLAGIASALAAKGHLVLRFNFPFAELKKKRADAQVVLDRSFKTAVQAVLSDPENAPARMLVGGIGLGARTATRAIAQGLKVDAAFSLGFPLHPSGKPSQQDVDYMYRIICPMLFVPGARDPHCRIDKLEELLRRVGAPTRLHVVAECGPGLEPVKRGGRTLEQIRDEVLTQLDAFVQEVIGRG
ncbi:MAG: alpha/beta hydrolase family protein [Steroidobacteraceae bacterium]